MNEKFKEEIQKRLYSLEWDKKISKLVLVAYRKEKYKTLFIQLSFSFLFLGIITLGNFLFQNSTEMFQEGLKIYENLELSFMEEE